MLQPLTNEPLIAVMIVLLSLAMVADLRARRIPNRLIALGLLIGLVGNVAAFGWMGFVYAFGGGAAGLLCLLPFYATGSMGAGDAKLMAMCGAFLGPVIVVIAAALSLLAGGIIGIALFMHQCAAPDDDELPPVAAGKDPAPLRGVSRYQTVPFAFAIGAGVLVAIAAGPQIGSYLQGVS